MVKSKHESVNVSTAFTSNSLNDTVCSNKDDFFKSKGNQGFLMGTTM